MYNFEQVIQANRHIKDLYDLYDGAKHIFEYETFIKNTGKNIREEEWLSERDMIQQEIIFGTEKKFLIQYFWEGIVMNKSKIGKIWIPQQRLNHFAWYGEMKRRKDLIIRELMMHIPDNNRTMSYTEWWKKNE